ncbi:malate:quinone oxidoreductase [Acinetobacter baumannii]
MLGLIKTCFPERMPEWEPRLKQLIPSYGETLNTRPDAARAELEATAQALAINA